MATNKVIKVTVIPTLTGDTIASYNVYSNIDGLLGAMTIAEAAAGKLFALSDGASHNITVKGVWTTGGETTTVGSNIVVIDLTVINYLLRIENVDNYTIRDADGDTTVDPKTLQMEITIDPLDLNAVKYIYEAGHLNYASSGLMQIRVSTDGTIRLTRSDDAGANTNTINSTTAIIAGQDNTISLVNGVLTINGVNQNIDISTWGVINVVDGSSSYGINFFGTKTDGTDGIVGDIKALNYKGNTAVFASDGITIPNVTIAKSGTENMIGY